MTRIPAGRAVLVALALAGLGACTVVGEDSGYYASAPGYATVPGRYGVPDYAAAAAAAGDSYCQEAAAAVRRAEASAAYTGSPDAIARMERARGYASRDC